MPELTPAELDELAALREQTAWRPIADLPNGCTRILACDADGDVFTAMRAPSGMWFDDGSFVRVPIYFQHLPKPPKEQA